MTDVTDVSLNSEPALQTRCQCIIPLNKLQEPEDGDPTSILLFIHPFHKFSQSTYSFSIIDLGLGNTEINNNVDSPKNITGQPVNKAKVNLLELAEVRENTTLKEF